MLNLIYTANTQKQVPGKLQQWYLVRYSKVYCITWYVTAKYTVSSTWYVTAKYTVCRTWYVTAKHTVSSTWYVATAVQLVPGTAAYNQQDRRRASDGGRATEGERYMYTANTPVPAVAYHVHIVRYTRYISALVLLLCTTKARTAAGERRRARDVCTPQYSICTWCCFVVVEV